jgi:suppressor for copper-sensitivity B
MTQRRSPVPPAALAALLLFPLLGFPAAAQMEVPAKARVELAADRTAYAGGAEARIAARIAIEPGWHVNSHTPTFEYLIPTELRLELPAGWSEPALEYPQAKLQKFAFEEQPLSVYDGTVTVVARLAVPAKAREGRFPVVARLAYQACNDRQCLPPTTAEAKLELTVGPGGAAMAGPALAPPAPAATAGGAPPVRAPRGLAAMLLLGLLGGLILNAMPCVLPVLSLKVFGMVKSAGQGRSEVVRGALATAAGILASFWALALAAIAARAAGAAVGWGVQFQRPGFVALLAAVVVLFCLNLWGLFEIPLPGFLARVGGSGRREGMAGHFTSGLFATLMATPCSAPFLGTAVSFALAQEAPAVLAVFTAIGIGMALPYLALAAAPGTARLLPRPGAWMEAVRGAMGFLLAAAAVWLLYVLSSQVSPERLAAVELALLGLALFAWFRHRFGGARAARAAGALGMAAAVVLSVLVAARSGGTGTGAAGRAGTGPVAGLIAWTDFDRAEAQSLAASCRTVFVDVTADWCFTCKVNERLVLETPEVAEAFRDHGVVAMKADWTNPNPEIAAYLAEHGRNGIPFYLLYRPGGEPQLLGELLTREGVVTAVRDANQVQMACTVGPASALPPSPFGA